MLDDLLGWTGMALALALASVLARKRPKIAIPLFIGAALRVLAALFQYYIAPLPDSQADAQHFEKVAWALASSSGSIVDNFHYSASFIYSAIMACLYQLVGRSPLMLQAISVMAGIACIYLVHALALRVWDDERVARCATWLAALFPTAILYSALTMREMFFDLFLLSGLLCSVAWSQTERHRHIVAAVILLLLGFAFHSGMIAALAALAILIVVKALTHAFSRLTLGKVQVPSLGALFGLAGIVLGCTLVDPHIPKIGQFSALFSPDTYVGVLANRVTGTAAFPAWSVPASGLDLLWAVPLRVAYFLWSPFPWDVTGPQHLLGVVDAGSYLALSLLSLGSIDNLWRKRGGPVVLLVLFGLTLAFAIGTGNFGTALRHRIKILFLLIVLAAPMLAATRQPDGERSAQDPPTC